MLPVNPIYLIMNTEAYISGHNVNPEYAKVEFLKALADVVHILIRGSSINDRVVKQKIKDLWGDEENRLRMREVVNKIHRELYINKNKEYEGLLKEAVQLKNTENVTILQKMVNFRDMRDRDGVSFFMGICQSSSLWYIQYFRPHVTNGHCVIEGICGWNAFHYAILHGQNLKVVEYLHTEFQFDVNEINPENKLSPLHCVILRRINIGEDRNQQLLCKFLKEKGARILSHPLPNLEESLNGIKELKVYQENSCLKESIDAAIYKMAAEELNDAINKTTGQEIKGKALRKANDDLNTILNNLKKSYGKEEVVVIPVKGALPFHKICSLFREALIECNKFTNRYLEIMKTFISCRTDLIHFKAGNVTGSEILLNQEDISEDASRRIKEQYQDLIEYALKVQKSDLERLRQRIDKVKQEIQKIA